MISFALYVIIGLALSLVALYQIDEEIFEAQFHAFVALALIVLFWPLAIVMASISKTYNGGNNE